MSNEPLAVTAADAWAVPVAIVAGMDHREHREHRVRTGRERACIRIRNPYSLPTSVSSVSFVMNPSEWLADPESRTLI